MARRIARKLVALAAAAGLALLLAVDWRTPRPAAPRLESVVRQPGPLRAGAARVELRPELPRPLAGYPPPRAEARSVGTPLYARAVVIEAGGESIGLASAEVLEIPSPLAARLSRRARALGLSAVVVGATHAHTSFGGYDRNPLVQWAATGAHDDAAETLLEDGLLESLRQAKASLQAVRLQVARGEVPAGNRNRHGPDRPTDRSLVAASLDGERGEVARLFVFAAHATLAPRKGDALDGDWPGRAMALSETKGGVTLFFQGPLGDLTSTPPQGPLPPLDAMAQHVAIHVESALTGSRDGDQGLGLALVEFELPPAQADHAVPPALRRGAANLLEAVSPGTATAGVLRLGDLWLLLTPAEPTVAAAAEIQQRLQAHLPAGAVVGMASLTLGYVGYLESTEGMRSGSGEAKRTLFGEELLGRVSDALAAALDALRPPAATQP